MNHTATSLRKSATLRWLCVVALAYYAAVTIGDTVATSVFIARAGASNLPYIFLIKAGIDVVASLLYLPLTRNRSARSVWRSLLCFYMAVIALGWLAVSMSSLPTLGAYLLYGGHEVAWTLAVVHWGIFLLDTFSPSESRIYFPILFGVGRVGALLGGLIVWSLAAPLGTSNLLGLSGVLALFSTIASYKLPKTETSAPHGPAEPKAETGRGLSLWRAAARSPLVRAIALSTATMVFLRYGLRMVSLAEIRSAYHGDEDQIESFLGLLTALGNAGAIVLSIWVIPRFLARVGVGVANLSYAATTLVAFVTTWLFPGLASASTARFVEMPLKHSLKTPLSVLFYGAESPSMRIAARSFIFGFAIPIAAISSAIGLKRLQSQLQWISILGALAAVFYLFICHLQNRRYQEGLQKQLEFELEHAPALPEKRAWWNKQLQPILASPSFQKVAPLLERGLASAHPHTVALALAWAVEVLPIHATKKIQDLQSAAPHN